jgi:hypothetical protein
MATTKVTQANLDLMQGDDWIATVLVLVDHSPDPAEPFDLTGYSAVSHIRLGPADSHPDIIVDMQAEIVDPVNGEILLLLTHNQTETLVAPRYVWDLAIISATGLIKTVLGGQVAVTKEVTRTAAETR